MLECQSFSPVWDLLVQLHSTGAVNVEKPFRQALKCATNQKQGLLTCADLQRLGKLKVSDSFQVARKDAANMAALFQAVAIDCVAQVITSPEAFSKRFMKFLTKTKSDSEGANLGSVTDAERQCVDSLASVFSTDEISNAVDAPPRRFTSTVVEAVSGDGGVTLQFHGVVDHCMNFSCNTVRLPLLQ